MNKCLQCGKVYLPWRKSSRYCSRECQWINNGKNQGQDKDHEIWWMGSRGYVEGRVWRDGVYRWVRKHRWIMEGHLGRRLNRWEVVHHINGNITDNRIENLAIKTNGQHTREHQIGRKRKNGYKLNLTDQERKRRSDWMRSVHQKRRANN